MALDDALLDRARGSLEPVLRLYQWQTPTLSLGRNQLAAGCYDRERARELGVSVVRRRTGGRAVLHHREITYSVTSRTDALGGGRESYVAINRLLVDALRRMGVAARAAEQRGEGVAPLPNTAPCFREPVAGEIVAVGRKLVGSAQWRDREVLLQHGSILVDDDQALATSLLVNAPPAPRLPSLSPVTLRELIGRAPTMNEAATALCDSVREETGEAPLPLEADSSLETAMRHALCRYEDDSWTWRR